MSGVFFAETGLFELVLVLEERGPTLLAIKENPEAAAFLGAPIRAVKLTVGEWRVTDIPNGWLPGKELSG